MNKEGETKKERAPREPTHKYTVAALAEALGVNQFTARNKLRAANIDKDGFTYGWNTKTAFEEVVKKLKAEAPKEPKEPKEPKAAKEAKKSAASKPATKASKKDAGKPATLKKAPAKKKLPTADAPADAPAADASPSETAAEAA